MNIQIIIEFQNKKKPMNNKSLENLLWIYSILYNIHYIHYVFSNTKLVYKQLKHHSYTYIMEINI